MIKKIFLILYISLTAIFISSCSDAPSSFGTGILDSDKIKLVNVDSFTDSLSQTSSSFKTVVPLGASNRLLVGKRDNVEASFLLKFLFPLADTLKQDLQSGAIAISEAKLLLTRVYQFGDSSSTLSISAHKVTSDWSSIGFTADSLPLQYDALSSSNSFIESDSINTIDLDVNLVRNWMQSEIDPTLKSNKGLYVKAPSATKVVGFQAFSNLVASIPKLQVVFNRSGIVTDTITYLPGGDVSIVEGNLPAINSQNIVTQSGLVVNSKLWFDVSSIPNNSVINNAKLILTLDTLETFHTDIIQSAMVVSNIVDSTSKVIDSTLNRFSLLPNGNTYDGVITSFVQKWIATGDNQGVLISPALGIENVDKFVFKGSNADSLSQRPRLEIIYTKRK